MKNYVTLILLVFLGIQLSVATGDEDVKCELCHKSPQNLIPHVNGVNFCVNCHNNQSHNIHIGPGTVGLQCDTCHGSPPVVTQAHVYPVCGNCHAAPPDSLKPSFGNLIVIHLSRGKYCTTCHGTNFDTIHSRVQVKPTYIVPTPEPTVQTPINDNMGVNLDFYGGFLPVTLTINVGTEVIWENSAAETLTLVSNDGLFDARTLSNAKRTSYIFNKEGIFSFKIKENPNVQYGKIIVNSEGITQTPTVTTPTVTTPTVTTPTVTTPTVTTTPSDVQNSKVALLKLEYKLGRKDNGAEVTVTLKNIGYSTARLVNLSMNIPANLGAIIDSGAEMNENTMVWKGDIESGKEHVIIYHVGAPKTDIEIPVKVTYINSEKTLNKVLASASAQGMSASSMAIDPQDQQTILFIIQIAKSLLSGFEIALAIAGIGVIYAIRKNK